MRTALLASACVTTAGLVTTALIAGQGTASAGTGHTLLVHEKFTRTSTQDIGKKGVSMGDRLVFATEVRDLKGRKLGIGAGDCVVFGGTTDTDAQYNCTESYRLDGDRLFVGGIFAFSSKVNKWVIMGGTGRYRGASGEVDFTTLAPDTFSDTFRFTD
jgi:hypothetical protein